MTPRVVSVIETPDRGREARAPARGPEPVAEPWRASTLPTRWAASGPSARPWIEVALEEDVDIPQMAPIQLAPPLHEEPEAQVDLGDGVSMGFGASQEFIEPAPFQGGFDYEGYRFSDSLITLTWALDLDFASAMIGTIAAHHTAEDPFMTTMQDPELAWAAVGFRFRF